LRKREADAIREETLASAIPTVSVTNAKPGAPTETITLPGNVEAWFQAPIYAQVSGYVKMWYKDYGAQVKKGDILAEINTPTLDAQYSQAKAALEAERAKYNLAVVTAQRWSALRKTHAVSEQDISVQEANMQAEKAKLEAAEHNVNNFAAQLQFKTIVAPYDGVVTTRNINVGDYINKDGNISDKNGVTNLFSVADIHQLRLFISVPEAFAHILKPNLTAEVTVPQFPKRRFTAKFLTVAKGFDPTTRTAVTEFTIDNEDKALWPGSYAAVRLTVPLDDKALTVSSSALVFQENGAQVAVVGEDDRIHFQSIRINRILDGIMEVASGVSREDRIVNNPSASLLEGDQVRVVTSAPGYEIDPSDLN
jgi:RND family efflux transporter MFP subunit